MCFSLYRKQTMWALLLSHPQFVWGLGQRGMCTFHWEISCQWFTPMTLFLMVGVLQSDNEERRVVRVCMLGLSEQLQLSVTCNASGNLLSATCWLQNCEERLFSREQGLQMWILHFQLIKNHQDVFFMKCVIHKQHNCSQVNFFPWEHQKKQQQTNRVVFNLK